MHPHTTGEEIGANDWREAAEEVLSRARAISRQAAERVREATGETSMTAALNDEAAKQPRPIR